VAQRIRGQSLNRLMADAHRRRLDVVCVWKCDRFCAIGFASAQGAGTFKAFGIEFCSFSEQMDTSTLTGKMREPVSTCEN
jgi:DNA invertase Pin-like site-specific DNA recombinase